MAQHNDPRKYVNDLELNFPEHVYGIRRVSLKGAAGDEDQLVKDKVQQSFIADKSLISFVSNISADDREAVLQTTLLAQLAANKKVPDQSKMVDWYNAYIEVMSNVGWDIEGKATQDFDTKGSLVEVQGVIIEILTAALGGAYIEIIKAALTAFKSMADESSGKIIAFEKNTHSASNGGFQMGLATEENGTICLTMATFLISSSDTITQILFFKFSNNKTNLKYASSKGTLVHSSYNIIKADIQNKLSGKATQYLAAIDI